MIFGRSWFHSDRLLAAANSLPALLAGYVTSYTETFHARSRPPGYVPGTNVQHMRWMNHAFFAQDTWKVRPGLSLDKELRWDQLPDSATFGRVTPVAFDQRIVQFALKYSF